MHVLLKNFQNFLCTKSLVQAERQGPWASCLSEVTFNFVQAKELPLL